MIRRPPKSTLTHPLVPYTTPFRAARSHDLLADLAECRTPIVQPLSRHSPLTRPSPPPTMAQWSGSSDIRALIVIDINTLTESELVDLNHRIVERLRFLQQARAHVGMLPFRIGQQVSFEPAGIGPLSAHVGR